MHPHLVEYLLCPVCGGDLRRVGNAVRCDAGHSFDLAKQGYLNLLVGGRPPGTADTPAMVQARADFLGAGHFARLAARLAHHAAAEVARQGLVVDAGAGTGYYLHAVLEASPFAGGIGLDISKFALRRAARAHPRAGAVVWDLWRPWPLRDHCAHVVLDLFAPRNGPEFHRVLKPEGLLLVVTPTPRHLQQLVGPLGLLTVDERKEERLEETLAARFRLEGREEIEYSMELDHAAITAAVAMGPSARHREPEALGEAVAQLPAPLTVTASFLLSRYRPIL